MRASVNFSDTLKRVTVDQHRAIEAKRRETYAWEMAEREQQFQWAISGTLGTVPAEVSISQKFDHLFLFEYGYKRDSQLQCPLVRFGFSDVSAPSGTIPYAHVQSWIQNDDYDYIGAVVIIGAHCPSLAIGAGFATTAPTAQFSMLAHGSFQGYGAPLDPVDQ